MLIDIEHGVLAEANPIKTSARAAPIALVMYILLGACSIPEPLPELPWFGTFLGGAAGDDCDAVTTDREGYVYLACHVVSVDLPGIGDRQLDPGDPMNAYIVKLTPQLDAAKWGVLLAGSGYDGAFAIAVDERGQVFVTGLTASPDFPTTASGL